MMKPDEIYAESFRIIEAEVGEHSFAADQWQIVRRMIHASGDLDLAAATRFYRDAVTAGVDALRRGLPIVTDVNMVAAGLNKQSLGRLGVRVVCLIDDPEIREQAIAQGRDAQLLRHGKSLRSSRRGDLCDRQCSDRSVGLV